MPHIEKIEIFRAELPFIEPFRTAAVLHSVRGTIFVKITAGQFVGWGEASPGLAPQYSPECAATDFIVARDFLAPSIVGKDIDSPDQLQAEMKHIKGNYFAKGAIDAAWWDLHAKKLAKPLWKVIGGVREKIKVGGGCGILKSVDALLEEIEKELAQGHTRIKLKYGPGWELDILRRVRDKFPDITLHIDCNSAYTLDDIDMLCELDQFNLEMIEQPLMHDDLIDHAKLQKQIKTPVCLDESITSPAQARKAIEIGACQWVNIKPGRVGGVTNSLKIHDICQASGVGCWIGGMFETSVGTHLKLALATLKNIKYSSDIGSPSKFFREDIGKPAIEVNNLPFIDVPDTPGIGCEPDMEMLKKFTVEYAKK